MISKTRETSRDVGTLNPIVSAHLIEKLDVEVEEALHLLGRRRLGGIFCSQKFVYYKILLVYLNM